MWRVGQHLLYRPLHVGAQRCAEFRIVGQPDVVGRADEAIEESTTQIAHVSVARVHLQHRRMVTTRLRVPGRPTHDLSPVGGESFDMLRVLPGMRERVIQLRVLETPLVMCRGQGEKCSFPPGEREQRGTHHVSVAYRTQEASRTPAKPSDLMGDRVPP